MKVWVIMGNDYPDSVFASEEAAEKYIAGKKAEHLRAQQLGGGFSRIHWRSYEFEVKQ